MIRLIGYANVCLGILIYTSSVNAFSYNFDKKIVLPGEVGAVRQVAAFQDGRLLIYSPGELYEEQQAESSVFVAKALTVTSTAVSLKISPNQLSIAIADSNHVHTCEIATGVCNTINFSGFQLEWIDNQFLLITASPFVAVLGDYDNTVTVLDTLSPDVQNPNTHRLIDLPGFQAGLALDANENLVAAYFENNVGNILMFDKAIWQNAWNNEQTLDEANGVLLGTSLTGAYLGFDEFRGLHVGGGNLGGSPMGVIVPRYILSAIEQGANPFDSDSEGVQVLAQPSDCPVNFMLVVSALLPNRIVLNCYSSNTADIYQVDTHNVPISGYVQILLFMLLILYQRKIKSG